MRMRKLERLGWLLLLVGAAVYLASLLLGWLI